MMGKRKTEADYRRLAESRGFEFVGDYSGDVRAKVEWRCSKQHIWLASYDLIRQGKGCPYCAGNARKVPGDYVKLGKSYGFEWLGPIVTNARTKTKWKCSEGHIFEKRYDQLKRAQGCPFCIGLARKTESDYHSLAKSRNMEWVDDELPKNVATKSKWRCSEGHIWLGVYGHILQGVGCPYCAGTVQKTAADYHTLAQAHDHEWIADEIPQDIHTVTKWRCARGHIRETCYNNVKKFGCPKCLDMVNGVQVSKPQRQFCEMVGGELNHICGRYRIDVALLDKMIAIEYDSWFWHGHKQELDMKRDEYMFARGWKVLRVKSDNQVPSWHQIEKAVAQLIAGEKRVEIILDDWGQGQTFADIEMIPNDESPHIQLELF